MCVSLPRVSNNIGVDIITIKRSVKKVFSFLTKGRTTLPKNFGISEYRFLIVENISTSRKTIGLANKLIIMRKANTLPQNSISFITLLFCKDNIFLVVWGQGCYFQKNKKAIITIKRKVSTIVEPPNNNPDVRKSDSNIYVSINDMMTINTNHQKKNLRRLFTPICFCSLRGRQTTKHTWCSCGRFFGLSLLPARARLF